MRRNDKPVQTLKESKGLKMSRSNHTVFPVLCCPSKLEKIISVSTITIPTAGVSHEWVKRSMSLLFFLSVLDDELPTWMFPNQSLGVPSQRLWNALRVPGIRSYQPVIERLSCAMSYTPVDYCMRTYSYATTLVEYISHARQAAIIVPFRGTGQAVVVR